MNTEEIKTALKSGKAVYWQSPNYSVSYRATTDELFVICRTNSHMIGVGKYHKPSDFYIGGGK
tara:strand:+ start:143 stop:331 length:189 start_codon:yes stop_codon:yes gene_type:complete